MELESIMRQELTLVVEGGAGHARAWEKEGDTARGVRRCELPCACACVYSNERLQLPGAWSVRSVRLFVCLSLVGPGGIVSSIVMYAISPAGGVGRNRFGWLASWLGGLGGA